MSIQSNPNNISIKQKSKLLKSSSYPNIFHPHTLITSYTEDKSTNLKNFTSYFLSPIKSKKNRNAKQIIIEIPFSLIFLFYYKDFETFRYILLASINFSDNYNTISFNEQNIYDLIQNSEFFVKENDDNEKSTNSLKESDKCGHRSMKKKITSFSIPIQSKQKEKNFSQIFK